MNTTAAGLDAYDFVAPAAIHFGDGRIVELGAVAAALGRRAWLVTGARRAEVGGGPAALARALAAAGADPVFRATSAGEPTVEQVAELLQTAPRDHADVVVVAVGGGSTIDLAKALAALATNADPTADPQQAVLDHLEGAGRSLPIRVRPLPVVAVPTTAGTGAEATRNAVISCPKRRLKRSIRSPLMIPRAALVDPELTRSCPRETVAASGLDCITQLVESYVCRIRRPLPRALVRDAIPRAVRALPRLLAGADDSVARAAMGHAALISGMALTNAGLGMAHGVAAALGIECGVSHGVACGLLLPVAVRTNLDVARDDYAALERAIAPAAPADSKAAAAAFLERIEALCDLARTPRRLAEVGLRHERIAWLAANSGGASMRGNPLELPPERLLPILEEAF